MNASRGLGWAVCIGSVLLALASALPSEAATLSLQPSVARGPLGEVAQISDVFAIGGTEYGGFPEPLLSLTLHLPFAIDATPAGSATCAPSTLQAHGPEACPPTSRAGAPGTIDMVVAFGSEMIPETAALEPFFGPSGTIYFAVEGHTPVSIEALVGGALRPDSPPYATALELTFPQIETVPGGGLTSTTGLQLNLGPTGAGEPGDPLIALPTSCAPGGTHVLASAVFRGGAGAQASATSACLAAAAPPVLGQREGVTVTSGRVSVRRRGSTSFVPIEGAADVPDGSEVDATAGQIRLTVATPVAGVSQSADVHGGQFLVHQQSTGQAQTRLTLSGSLAGCAHLSSASHVASARGRAGSSRRLWVSENGGSWSTKGHYVSTSVEGTSWLTADRCGASEVRVMRGRVKVRDLVHRKTRILGAGQALTVTSSARAGRRP